MKVSDIMTQNVVSVRRDAPVAEAVNRMLDNRISGLPVVDADQRVVGMLTEGDLLRRSETETERRRPRWLEFLLGPARLADEYVKTHGRVVAELMTREIVAVAEDTSLDEVVRLMETHRIKRVPVLRDGSLVGIVSRADLLRALRRSLAAAPAAAAGDETIRKRVLAALADSNWSPRQGITIGVENGIVDLKGIVFDDKQRAALRVAAENVPGVKAVRDHLTWVEPVTGALIDLAEDGAGANESTNR